MFFFLKIYKSTKLFIETILINFMPFFITDKAINSILKVYQGPKKAHQVQINNNLLKT